MPLRGAARPGRAEPVGPPRQRWARRQRRQLPSRRLFTGCIYVINILSGAITRAARSSWLDVFHYDAFWTWVLNPVGASVGEELSAKNDYNYPWALCIFAVLLALRHGVERCFACWFS